MQRIVPVGVFGAVLVGVAWLWYGPPTRLTDGKPEPSALARAAAAGINPTTLIVDFKDDVSSAALARNAYTEVPISAYSELDRLYRIQFATADEAARAASALASDPSVESVDYDVPASIPPDEVYLNTPGSMEEECAARGAAPSGAFPDDPCFKYQWHLRQLGLPDGWKLGQGKGVVVAVIDTGVSRVGDLAKTHFVPGYNFVSNGPNAEDDHGHGTHVAGTIAQSTNNGLGVSGVAYAASIMPLKVLSANGSGSMAAIAQAIRYAADRGAHVINMSLGGRFPMGTIGNAVKYARSRGVVIVAAAGNDGKGSVSYPAHYPGVIGVAATQFDETTTFYSNWGPQIDIAAPGGNVRVDQNGDGKPDGVLQHTLVLRGGGKTDYQWFMGTSMASPHVAGAAALVVGAGINNPDAVEQVLLDTARKPKHTGSDAARIDDHYGAGVVDAGAALRKVRAGRGASELGLGAAVAMLGVCMLRRRGRLADRLGLGFALALVAGSSGLFVLPFLTQTANPILNAISSGFALGVADSFGPSAHGNPLIWSAIAPLVLTVLLYGIGRARPALAGFGFGVAGALLFAGLAGTVDVRYVPDFLDRAWLLAHAVIATIFATLVIRR